MKHHSLAAAVVLAALSPAAVAQPCDSQWSDEFVRNPIHGSVLTSAVFDDGSGPALYLGGTFSAIHVSPHIRNIARWNGSRWTNVGAGFTDWVHALAVFDDGSGPALYAGGRFAGGGTNHLARWDGTSWSPVGPGADNTIRTLDVIDVDGSGANLYAGGWFSNIGGVAAYGVARWDGQTWFPLGDGLSGPAYAIAAYDDGTGPALYVGGQFMATGGSNARSIARLDGDKWSAVGNAFPFGLISDLRVHDDGSGPQLYAGGYFTQPFPRIARWNGSEWSGLGEGFNNGIVHQMISHDDGTGNALYAFGDFTGSGTQSLERAARWDGQTWSPLGTGINRAAVHTASIFDDGEGDALYIGGSFTIAPGNVPYNSVRRWRNNTWTGLSNSLAPYPAVTVTALVAFDDGNGPAIYVGGDFAGAGGHAAKNIARWDGSKWSPLGDGLPRVWSLEVYDDGAGPTVYATTHSSTAGTFFRWSGEEWHGFQPPFASPRALAAHDDGSGPSLFVSGRDGQIDTIARWNGQWHALAAQTNSGIAVLRSFDLGQGSQLFAGGSFTQIGNLQANRIAAWSGSTWTPLGNGLSGSVLALEVFDDGAGPLLHAGGTFTVASGGPANSIARWNGTDWEPLGADFGGTVYAMTVFDDGHGPSLNVGGTAMSLHNIARWDGSEWHTLGTGLGGSVWAFASFDHTPFPQLLVGGLGLIVNGQQGFAFARWSCTTTPPEPCYANCDHSTTPPVLTINDFTCFINEFANALSLPHSQQLTHYANCDNSTNAPILNVDDFTCFINEFAQGCP